jgi:RNA polymerase sigma-70 factor (ECF subfamily)
MFFAQLGQPLSPTPILTSKEATAKAAETNALLNPLAATLCYWSLWSSKMANSGMNSSDLLFAQQNPFRESLHRKRMSDSPVPQQASNRVRAGCKADSSQASGNGSAKFATAYVTNPADADVLARAQAGDHQAFAQLYSLHKRRIYSLCLRMVGNIAEAEDLTQEAFLQLHRKIATFRGDSAFSTWLHRLAINVVLMQLRKKGLSLISLDEAMEPTPDEGPSRSFGAPDLTLTGAIDRLALERAVADLPAGYRLIFILHDVEGFEHNEIATMLECSIGNSKSQLHKARLKLRDALRAQSRQEVQQ